MKGHGLSGPVGAAAAAAATAFSTNGDDTPATTHAASTAAAGPEEVYTVYEFDASHEKTLMDNFLQLTENRRASAAARGGGAVTNGAAAGGSDEKPGKKKKTRTLLPAFISNEFLDTLQPEGVFKQANPLKVRRLYARFLRSPHFEPWFRKQRDAVARLALGGIGAAEIDGA